MPQMVGMSCNSRLTIYRFMVETRCAGLTSPAHQAYSRPLLLNFEFSKLDNRVVVHDVAAQARRNQDKLLDEVQRYDGRHIQPRFLRLLHYRVSIWPQGKRIALVQQ